MKKPVYIHKFKTNLGWFRLASTEKGLAIINFTDPVGFKLDMKKRFGDYQVKAGGVINKKAEKQIISYLSGKLKNFSLKLDLEGTPFQRRVLGKVGSVPYGKTITYGKIAASITSLSLAVYGRGLSKIIVSARLYIPGRTFITVGPFLDPALTS